MEIYKAIMTRRSIRQFTEDAVSQQLSHQLLQAAMQAPSARNTQPWHFVVIDEHEIMKQIAGFHPYAAMLVHAPLAITVCGDLTIEQSVDYLALNCAAATENILLAAHGLNLGAVSDFFLAHPNIGGAQSYHNAAGMILRGPGAEDDQATYKKDDPYL